MIENDIEKEIKRQKMNERKTMEYIQSLQQYGSVLGLDNMKRLCDGLNNIQEQLKIIHIAGTNGKGSTLAFIATILMEAGYKVGRYISPTVSDYRECIQINKRKIGIKDLCTYMSGMKELCEEITKEGYPHPTQFEIETALAFCYFADKGCDFVLLETGLGGAMDATNIIKSPLLCVLASISMDHMGFLGNTLEEITKQKCGIIKQGCPVISTKQEEEAKRVIVEACQPKNAKLTFVDTENITKVKLGIKKQKFCYGEYKNCEITLSGTYQIQNAALALEVVTALKKLGFVISEKAIFEGLKKTEWNGRFQIISERPLFIVDGAHNEDAARKLAESVQFYFTNKKIIYIMGVLKDKEYEKIIENTYPFADKIITVKTPNNVRAMDAYELAMEVSKYHSNVTMADSIQEAVELAYLLADKDSVIVAFGSLSYLGDLIRSVKNREKKIRDTHGIAE